MIRNQRGSAILVVAGIIVVLSVIVDAVMVNYDSNMKSLEAFSSKRQAFYMAEGVRALSTVLIEDFLMTNPADEAALKAHLDTQLPALMPAPFSVSPVGVKIIKTTPSSTISSGPFKGMNGPITDVALNFNVLAPSSVFSGDIVEPLELRLSVGYISMFQFMAFFDIGQFTLGTGPEMEMLGRLHANGDFCVGGSSGFQNFLKLTVGGRLMSNADGRCSGGGGGTSRTRIATNPNNFTGSLELRDAYDNGCTNCNGTGLNWEAFALSRWREQAQDMAHGVQILKLPGAGSGQVQLREAGNFGNLSNTNNLRFIVDPVIATDSASVRTYKYAYNADIRILNGVWYIKNPLDAADWPGLPVWSDHPGRFTETVNGTAIAVGQDDIRDRWAATRPWPASPGTPSGYSYYEYDQDDFTITPTAANEGVISYGNLINVGGATPQRPGHWVDGGGGSSLCEPAENLSCAGGCGFVNVQSALTCTPPAGAPTILPLATKVLNATRGGIRNGHIMYRNPAYANQSTRSRVLPINFDVAQLQAALANNGPGELGSYFGVTGFKGSPFNGVIYVSSVWPGANNGYGAGAPQEHSHHGSLNMPNPVAAGQATPTNPNVQQSLPQPLCSRQGAGPGEFAGRDFDRHSVAPVRARFRVPDCARYTGNPAPYPNALRVVNGANLDGARLPRGISIITNLPVYLVGNFNTNSNVSSSTALPWVPSLVGGDKVILLSNNWNDNRSGWSVDPGSINRLATNTTYNVALLTEPSSTLTSLLEDWAGRDLTVNGSMVYGYNAVYALHENTCCGNRTYDPPNRNFNFDPHFGLITNQPPGTPVFPVSAVSMWTKPQ